MLLAWDGETTRQGLRGEQACNRKPKGMQGCEKENGTGSPAKGVPVVREPCSPRGCKYGWEGTPCACFLPGTLEL